MRLGGYSGSGAEVGAPGLLCRSSSSPLAPKQSVRHGIQICSRMGIEGIPASAGDRKQSANKTAVDDLCGERRVVGAFAHFPEVSNKPVFLSLGFLLVFLCKKQKQEKWPGAIDLVGSFYAAEQKARVPSLSPPAPLHPAPPPLGTQYLHPSACSPGSLSSTAGCIAVWSAGGDGGAGERENGTAGASNLRLERRGSTCPSLINPTAVRDLPRSSICARLPGSSPRRLISPPNWKSIGCSYYLVHFRSMLSTING